MLVEKMMANEHETREMSTTSVPDSPQRAAPPTSPGDSKGNKIRLSGDGKATDSGGCCYSSKSH